ncbi:MAG: presenilin family intramembrane aspartyl protease [Candidatus Methanoperedens sp.]|nr:presenilin family intramembrane aspartyl protease [Candidatus Methanoperedens sp.]MCZ7371557.1 presenilin family intramembrane aspartyl protease [Candidatus Methanoperedens sp.]
MKLTNYIPFIGMGFVLLLVQLIAVALSEPLDRNDFRAFSNPEATSNVILWIAIILIFTAFIFLIIRMKKKWVIQAFIFLTVVSTLFYVFYALFSSLLTPGINFLLTIVLSISLTIVLYKFPEWYVIDIVGVIIGAGAASMFGISLAIGPTLLLLVLLAIYDYIAVYRTKHMIALAEGVMDLRLPILLVIPKHWKYSFLTEKFDKEEREAFFMGLGDAVMPTLLVVSAYHFVAATTLPLIGQVNLPAIGAVIGTFVGFAVLMTFVMKGKPQAGLPFLNGGVILGYLAGTLMAGTPLL